VKPEAGAILAARIQRATPYLSSTALARSLSTSSEGAGGYSLLGSFPRTDSESSMLYAVKLTTTIDSNRRVILQLPASTPEGEAEIIILFNHEGVVERGHDVAGDPPSALRDL
jgi:hypothetical protein